MGNVKNRPGQFGELYSDAIKSGRIIKTNKNDMHAQQHAAARPDFPNFLRTGRGGAPPPCSGGAGLLPSTRARARARALSIGKKLIKELMKKIMILLMIFSDTCSETRGFISACHLDHTVP